MSIVRIQAAMVVGIYPHSGANVSLSVDMSPEQRKAAILALLGDMPEPEAFQLLAGEFPKWFVAEAA